MKKLNHFLFLSGLLLFGFTISGCDDDDEPPMENPEEIITDVTLTFTPDGSSAPIVATATDPDGEGPEDLKVDGDITLNASTNYTLTIELFNDVSSEDVTEEIEDEDFEHMFFFAFSDELFDSPNGDGNVDSRPDPINYEDKDDNDLPVGLTTSWTTEDVATGTFRVVLKHQPNNIKTATSGANDGESDIDITWDLSVQ